MIYRVYGTHHGGAETCCADDGAAEAEAAGKEHLYDIDADSLLEARVYMHAHEPRLGTYHPDPTDAEAFADAMRKLPRLKERNAKPFSGIDAYDAVAPAPPDSEAVSVE